MYQHRNTKDRPGVSVKGKQNARIAWTQTDAASQCTWNFLVYHVRRAAPRHATPRHGVRESRGACAKHALRKSAIPREASPASGNFNG